MRVAVLTVSDRSSSGEREDKSGPVLVDMVRKNGMECELNSIVADDRGLIEDILLEWSDSGSVDLILTTGGTGFAPRDQAPEATLAVIDKLAPGLAEAMRSASMRKTPHAMLSRAVAGIRDRTLIVNLPGSPKAARENLEVILPALPHAIQLLTDDPDAEIGHHPPQRRRQA